MSRPGDLAQFQGPFNFISLRILNLIPLIAFISSTPRQHNNIHVEMDGQKQQPTGRWMEMHMRFRDTTPDLASSSS